MSPSRDDVLNGDRKVSLIAVKDRPLYSTFPKEQEKPPVLVTTEKSSTLYLRVHLLSSLAVVLVYCALSVASPVTTQYVYYRIGETYFNSTNVTKSQSVPCEKNATSEHLELQRQVQVESSLFHMYLSLAAGIPLIFSNFLIGSYSDQVGRKMLFLIPILGNTIRAVIYVAIILFNLNIYLFLVAYAVEGTCGGIYALKLAVFTANADITPPKNRRTLVITVIEGVLQLSSAVFSFIPGVLISSTGYLYPAVIMVVLMLAGAVVAGVFLPHTSPPKPSQRRLSPTHHIKNVLSFYLTEPRRRRLQFTLCTLVFVTYVQTSVGRTGVNTLYQLNRPFCWDSLKISYYDTLHKVVNAVGSTTAVFVLHRLMPLEYVVILGLTSAAASYILEGLAFNDVMMYLVTVVGMLAIITIPVARSIMSRLAPPDKQGAVLSGIASLEALVNTAATVLYNTVYAETLSLYRGFVFFIMAAFLLLAILFMALFRYVSRGEEITFKVDIGTEKSPSDRKERTEKSSAQTSL